MNALLDYLQAFGGRAKGLLGDPQNYLAEILQSLPDRNSLQGAVQDPEFYKGLLSNTKEVAGGLLTGAVGAPVDIATMMMRPGGYNVPDRNVVGSSNHLAGLLGLDAESTPYKVGSLLPTDAGDAAKYMGLLGQVAWHGSPHKFAPHASNPLGKFDMGKIGTGEGAQAYAHGLYFAEKDDVGRYYKNALSKDGGGALYKVDIPDEAVSKMADLDKPLNKQPENVRNAFKEFGFDVDSTKFKKPEQWRKAAYQYLSGPEAIKTVNTDLDAAKDIYAARKAWNGGADSLMSYMESPQGSWLRSRLTKAKGGDKTAQAAYRELAQRLGSPAEASKALLGRNVPGSIFYDQGNRNFITFSDELPNILARE